MSNGSLSLMRANVAMTTNVKLVVDTSYNLYLESYNSNRELSDKKYKKFLINSDSFLSERIAKFYQNLPSDLAYEVKNDIKSDTIQDKYINQYDDIYYSGPRNVEDNRYVEEFQYNTTLKINPNKLPKYFFIFRKDDPGVTNMYVTDDDYLRNLKVTQVYDLTPQTTIGKLWKKNYIDDDILAIAPLEINLNKYEFSQWNGYDYKTGGTVSKSFFLDEFMQNQTTDFEFESFLTDGFKKNEVVSSNYTNISYLFDDTVAGIFLKFADSGIKYYESEYPFIFKLIRAGKITDIQYNKLSDINGIYYTFNDNVPYRKKWTINRYSGFYVDELVQVGKVSSYTPVPFLNDPLIFIENNKFVKDDGFGNMVSVSPVNNYTENTPVHFKINEDLYLVEKVGSDYILISNELFNGNMVEYITNSQKSIKIEFTNPDGSFRNYIKNIDGTYYYNTKLEKYIDGISIIKIFDNYYTLIIDKDNLKTYINTDELMYCDSNLLSRQLGENSIRYDNLQILTKDNTIEYFDIYFIQFTDIRDWCFNRTQTNNAKIEYEYRDKIDYNRPFFYAKDVSDVSVPQDYFYEMGYNVNLYDQITEITTPLYTGKYILPLISEYAASGDLYMLTKDNNLTRIWDVNQSINKFGLSKSINTNAVEYKLNNSLDVWGQYNFTPNLFTPHISINDLNLDWFYTFGKPFNYSITDYNIGGSSQLEKNIINRTLNIDLQRLFLLSTNPNVNQSIFQFYKPDFNYYKQTDAVLDYFDYIFNVPYTLDQLTITPKEKSLNRIAYLLPSDNVNGPSLFFKGFNAYVQYVHLDNPNTIGTHKFTPANDLVDYGFVIAFNAKYTDDTTLHGKAGIDIVLNKIYKNILVNLYIYTPFDSLTSLDYRNRSRVYSEDTVKYGVYDSFTGIWSWKNSELKTQALTLNRFVSIISNNKLVDDNFTAGIKYEIIEKDEKIFRPDLITVDPLDNYTLIVTLTENAFFKENQWIKFTNTGLQEFDNNVQIKSKINNFVYKIKFNTDMTTVIAGLNPLDDITITNEKSVLPFKFKVIYPNEIKLNKNINIIIPDTSCPVSPVNSNVTIQNVSMELTTNDGVIPNIYTTDAISRKIFKTQSEKALTYNEIEKFPSIFRYSGYYEPMLNEIELFNKTALSVYNVNFTNTNDTLVNYMTVKTLDSGLTYNIVFDVANVEGSITKAEVGDILHFNNATDFNFLNFKTAHIISIDTVNAPINHVRIICSINLETIPTILVGTSEATPYDIDANGKTCNVFLMKVLNKNMSFNYVYDNFGVNNNIIISKVYDTVNILKTNNALNNMTNRYPMIDEHGVTTVNRNVFKSSWDIDYYYKTISNKII